jgi:hypothetical protein
LSAVDLSHMTQLTEIGANFLRHTNVGEVLLPRNLKAVGDDFLRSSRKKRIDLSATGIETVGAGFLSYSFMEVVLFPPTLKRMNVRFLQNVRSWERGWIEMVDLSETKLEILEMDCLKDAVVEELLLPTSLKTVHSGVLAAANIKRLDLSRTAITDIGSGFLAGGCVSELIMPKTVERISACFLKGATAKKIDFSRSKIVKVGGQFLYRTSFDELILSAALQGPSESLLNFYTTPHDDMPWSRRPEFKESALDRLVPLCQSDTWQKLYDGGHRGVIRFVKSSDREKGAQSTKEGDVAPTRSLAERDTVPSEAPSKHQGAERKRNRTEE